MICTGWMSTGKNRLLDPIWLLVSLPLHQVLDINSTQTEKPKQSCWHADPCQTCLPLTIHTQFSLDNLRPSPFDPNACRVPAVHYMSANSEVLLYNCSFWLPTGAFTHSHIRYWTPYPCMYNTVSSCTALIQQQQQEPLLWLAYWSDCASGHLQLTTELEDSVAEQSFNAQMPLLMTTNACIQIREKMIKFSMVLTAQFPNFEQMHRELENSPWTVSN